MDLVAGPTLADRLTRGRVAIADARRWLALIADALAVAHAAGVIHRDLKPDNLLLVDDPLCPVRVIDWGIALDETGFDSRLTLDGAVTGTPHYMAPEQARGLAVDGRCDVYALGILAYELLTGAPPFDGPSALGILAQHLTAVPPPVTLGAPATPTWFADLIAAMLAKAPDARPPMAAVAAALAARAEDTTADYEIEITFEAAPAPVIEMVAEMLEDDMAAQVDEVIAAIGRPGRRSRLAQGSWPRSFVGPAGVVWGELRGR